LSQHKKNPHRIRDEDLENAIFRPHTRVDDGENNVEGVLVFTLLGKNDGRVNENGEIANDGYPVLSDKKEDGELILAEDLEHAYAKSVASTRMTKYFVKRYTDGRLFNPVDRYTEHKHSKDIHVRGDNWKWSEVNKNTFINYLKFLTTRNQAWLTTAQRELI